MADLYFEDFSVGETRHFGDYELTKAEIIEFAEKYDPQPIHIDEKFAAESPHGGIIASGWQTAAICMCLAVEGLLNRTANRASPGIEELKWLHPVRPGDHLSLEHTILDKRQLSSKPELGHVRSEWTCLNQDDIEVLSMIGNGFIELRPG